MTATVQDWLPVGAASPARIAAALAAPFDQWSIDWFADAQAIKMSDRALALATHGEGQLSLDAGSVQFRLSAMGKRHLLEAILSETLAGKALSPADHQLLDKLAARACQDLIERLAALPAVNAAPNKDVRKVEILLGEKEFGRLALPSGAFVSLVRANLARSPASRPQALTDRRLAIGGCEAALDAILGRVAVTVDELNGLEPGDVLILDQRLDEPLPLRLLATGGILGKGKLTSNEGRNAIAWQP